MAKKGMKAKKLKMRTSKKKGVLIIRRKYKKGVVLRVRIPAKFLTAKGGISKASRKAYGRFRAKHIKRAQLKVQARLNKKCKSGRAYCGGRAWHTTGSKRCCPKGGKAAITTGKRGAVYARVAGKLVRLTR